MTLSNRQIRILKVLAFVACLGPLLNLVWKAVHILPWTSEIGFIAAGADRWNLGANPINVITRATGKATLIFVLITLTVTPARRVLGQPWLIRYRRMFGLFAFFYGSLHLATYVVLDQFFDVGSMIADIEKRKFITVGFAAFVLMIPLALTSTSGWIRRLGGKRWHRLHQLVYVTAVLAIFHFLWLVKFDITRPVKYGGVLAILLGYRIAIWLVERTRSARERQVIANPRTTVPLS
ncbi:MAG TPA: protein-methionine-sulfoxide reductase heme-binding subunit MsrQ [Terriglobales bacterium]|nr:protein-methionine-sulfoxide reductase heme-binding subunit MsrQ [Terriglobales bacterium]